jgi:exonuclease III
MQRLRIAVFCMQETWLSGSSVMSNKGYLIINNNKDGAHRRGVGICLAPEAVIAWNRTRCSQVAPCDRVLAVRLSYPDAKGKDMSFCIICAYRPIGAASQEEHEDFADSFEQAMQFAKPSDIVIAMMDGNGSIGVSSRDSVDFDGSVGPLGIAHSNNSGSDLLDIMRSHQLCSTTSFRAQQQTQAMRRANDRRRNLKQGGNRRTRQRRWRKQQKQREKQLCAKPRPPLASQSAVIRRTRSAEAQQTLRRRQDQKYASWTHPASKRPFQIDYIMVQQRELRRVRGAHVSHYSGGSDHRLLRCDIAMARSLARVKPGKAKPRINRGMLRDQRHRDAFIDGVSAAVAAHPGKLDWPDLDDILVKVAETSLTTRGRKQRAWFQAAEEEILWAQAQRNEAFSAWSALKKGKKGEALALARLRETRKAIRVVVRRARIAWLEATLQRLEVVKKGGRPLDPCDAWKAMQEIAEGMDQTVPPRAVPVRGKDGELAATDKEQLGIFVEHFIGVFNRVSTYDPSVLQRLQQRPVMQSLGDVPDLHEVTTFLRRAQNEKAKGLSGVYAEFYKAISYEEPLAQIVANLVAELWANGEPTESWKKGKLKEIGKANKDLSEPGNYRGVMLLEAAAKVISAIINARLQKLLAAVGRESQAGFTNGRGCPDSSFSLKNVLQSLREHGQESWVCFIDLVKAFDSIDRGALCDILLRYGAPPALVRVIKGLHKEVNVRMEIGEDFEEFTSSLGVLQGAAASPVLFLFVIAAWFETVDWPDPPVVLRSHDGVGPGARHAAFDQHGENKLKSFLAARYVSRTLGTPFSVREFLYADDAAVIWLTRKAMQAGMKEMVAHGARWGLEVHVAAAADKSSKTEFLVIPPLEHHKNHRASYDRSPVQIGDVFFTHAKMKIKGVMTPGVFKYLGSHITEDLSEDLDVSERIRLAACAFGKYKKAIFKEKSLSVEAKARAFTAYVLPNLLYQSECWALRRDQERRVEVFFNRCIRVMTGINQRAQMLGRITTEDMASRAGLRTCRSYLDEKCLSWLGHVARMQPHRLPRLALFSWYDTPRARGRPRHTLRHRYHELLKRVPAGLTVGARNSLLKHGWVYAAKKRDAWNEIIGVVCGISATPKTKEDRKTQHLEGRGDHGKVRGDEPNAAAAASGAHPPVAGAESEFGRLIRIGN